MRALPPKVLRELRVFLAPFDGVQPERWRAAIDAALVPKRAAKPAQARRAAKKATRREEMTGVRAAVLVRADGRCEACARRPTQRLEVDHFFGGSGRRRALQSTETCWGLCPSCHREKTRNVPSAATWLWRFITHAEPLGFSAAAQMARGRLAALQLQGRAG